MRYKCRGMHTVAFIVRRLLGAIPTLALVVALSFLLTRLAPGGPFDEEQALAPEIRANLEAAYGLDQPVHVQFARYVRGLLHGDFGPSFKFRDFTVSELIASGLRVSLALGSMAMLLALALGIPAGIWAARSRGGTADRLVMALAVAGISIPVFVVGPVLALVFGVWLGWLPVAGWLPGRPADLVLPVVSLALPVLAFIARLMRGSLLEVLRAPWIRAARARGLPERSVILRHALPAALLPVVSYVGPAAAAVLAGSLVVETLFGLPGMGRHLVQGALNRDYTLVMGMVIVYASLMIVLNLAADLVYASLDPRIRREPRL
jgi:oligopeptide transport system permease protein